MREREQERERMKEREREGEDKREREGERDDRGRSVEDVETERGIEKRHTEEEGRDTVHGIKGRVMAREGERKEI